jgi:hypothetical protein
LYWLRPALDNAFELHDRVCADLGVSPRYRPDRAHAGTSGAFALAAALLAVMVWLDVAGAPGTLEDAFEGSATAATLLALVIATFKTRAADAAVDRV